MASTIIKQPIGDSGCSWEHEYEMALLDSGYFEIVCKLYLVIAVNDTIFKATSYEPNIYFELTDPYGFGADWKISNYNFYEDGCIFNQGGSLVEIKLNKGRHLIQETTTTSPYTYTILKTRHDFSKPLTVKCDWTATDFTSAKINGESYSANELDVENILGTPEALASSISCSTTYIGETANIIIKKNDSSFTTTLLYTFGSQSGTIVEGYSGTSYRWQVPASFVNELSPEETEKTCIISCITYDNSGNQVGDQFNLEVTLLLDSSIGGPKFTSFVVENAIFEEGWENGNKILELTGDSSILVKYFSYAYAYATAEGQSGATVKSIKVSNSGKTYENGYLAMGPVESPEFTFVATDSRGFVSSATHLANWVDYSKLSCNAYIDIPTPFGETHATIDGNCFSGSFGVVTNTLKLEYTLHIQGETAVWKTVSATPTQWHNYYVELDFNNLDYKKTYVFQARATDKLMTITTPELIVTGEPIFDWGKEDFHMRVPLSIDNELIMATDKSIAAISPTGEVINAFTPCNSSGDAVLGYDGYSGESGDTYIYGNKIHLISNQGTTINGKALGGKILWTGPSQMAGYHTITLKENISSQISGIVLVFSAASGDVSVNSFFISKKEVEAMDGAPHSFFLLNNAGLATVGAKYLYISDGSITGHDTNTSTGTAASGITFTNNNFVLRYIIGV